MFSIGAGKIFTGEAGAVTYPFLLLLVALVYIGWAAVRRRYIGTRRFQVICLGFGLLLLSRGLFVSPLSDTHSWVALFTLTSGLAGFYLLFVSMLAASRIGGFEPNYREILLFGVLAGILFGGALTFGVGGKLAGTVSFPLLCSFATFVPVGFLVGTVREGRLAVSAGLSIQAHFRKIFPTARSVP